MWLHTKIKVPVMIKTFKNDENIPIDYSQTQVFLKMIANFVKTF